MISRLLCTAPGKSCFLFGPRQTGKSVHVLGMLREDDLYVDLLPRENFLAYGKDPGRFRQEVEHRARRTGRSFTCVIDEIQKIPPLLDEVHGLIESRKIVFVMTGSSARKLKRGASNLLAGRAYTYRLFPFVFSELRDSFDLERALRVGLLPPLWDQERDEDPAEFLYSYTETYLKEEIQAEGLVRNVLPFSRFLDIAAACDGQPVNMSNIARECGVSSVTVKQYYQILEDTFLAYRVPGWARSTRKQLLRSPRYYLFDPGVTNALVKNYGGEIDLVTRGRRFEQLFVHHCVALSSYMRRHLDLHHWRTNHGAEVDLLLCRGSRILAAVEIKSSRRLGPADASGLRRFREEHGRVPCFIVTIGARTRELAHGITVMDWKTFLQKVLVKL